MREALQLECLIRAPLEPRVRIEVAALLKEGDYGLEGPGEEDYEPAGGEDEGEEEDGKVGVCG